MVAPLSLVPTRTPIARAEVVGINQRVPLLDGRLSPYVNLDNAASTPALRAVMRTVDEFLPFYSGVHRGTGYKSRLSTAAFEQAREIVGRFMGADPARDVVVFTKNASEAVNKLAHSLPMPPHAVVLTTTLEHHSNDLPWRGRARTVAVRCLADGRLDLDHLDHLLRRHAGRIALLAVSGASNVTGVVQPVHELAARVHAVGGRILVDAAQLVAHRPLDLRPHDDPGHLDFVVMSAHKMYAPYGTGALIGPRSAFGPRPDHAGGGTVRAVTVDDVAWADLPDREEAGSPNVVGAVAMASAAQVLDDAGRGCIAAHEAGLTRYAVRRLSSVPGVTIHGPAHGLGGADRLGVLPFTVAGLDHALVAAVLGYEHGVGVRSGCFCAQPYIAHLLGLDRADAASWVRRVGAGDRRGAPGMVRMSLGCYNDESDIDRVVDGLERVVAGDVSGTYRADLDGSFHPVGYVEPMLFSLDHWR
jgi:selenocysteine lyase/cysteine desulfurase